MSQAERVYIKQEENIKTVNEILIPRALTAMFG